jgi:hypothetical protein
MVKAARVYVVCMKSEVILANVTRIAAPDGVAWTAEVTEEDCWTKITPINQPEFEGRLESSSSHRHLFLRVLEGENAKNCHLHPELADFR